MVKDSSGRYAQLFSGFPCSQVGASTPPVLQSYHYSPMYSYSQPCSKTNYYSSCGRCTKKLGVSDAYTAQPLYAGLYNEREYSQPREDLILRSALRGSANRGGCGCGY